MRPVPPITTIFIPYLSFRRLQVGGLIKRADGFCNHGVAPGITDIVPFQPLSGILNPRLANNGGPTQTHALVRGSPAIDAINDGTCPPAAKNQRGVSRPQDGNGDGGPACDIGSFELTVGVVAPLAPPGPLTATSPKPPGPPPAPVNQPLVTAPEPPPPVEPPPPLY